MTSESTEYGEDRGPQGGTGVPVEVLTGEQLQAALDVLPEGVADGVVVVYVLQVSVGSRDSSIRQVIYHECTGGHITMHVGHEDSETGMSVYDGSVATTIPCGSSSDAGGSAARPEVHAETLEGEVLESVAAALPYGTLPEDSTVVLVRVGSTSDDENPPDAIWSVSVCEDAHVVTLFGHEDPATMTSVYDGKVVTSIAC